jgi:hypothetical protein
MRWEPKEDHAMQLRPSICIHLGILVLALSVFPALAHHGWSGYGEEEFEIKGTVERGVSLAGPHATMRIRADGKVWDITLAPPPRTQASGLKEGVIPVGAEVTIHGHRNKDPKRLEVKTERVTWKDRTFNVYPDRK